MVTLFSMSTIESYLFISKEEKDAKMRTLADLYLQGIPHAKRFSRPKKITV